MENQVAYDRMVNHLRKQGRRSLNDVGVCMYRGPDGLMCAVGVLIPDEKYHQGLENKAVSIHSPGIVEHLLEELGVDIGLAKAMLIVHDTYQIDLWEHQFQEVAKGFGLIYTSPEEHKELLEVESNKVEGIQALNELHGKN